MFFSSIKEINKLISRGMSNIYYWEKLTFSKLVWKEIYWKENLKKCSSFGKREGTRYIVENVYFGIIVFSCHSSTKLCLIFLLTWFALEIKDFYQSFLRNEADFRDIMNVQISMLKIKISKNWDTVLETKEQW